MEQNYSEFYRGEIYYADVSAGFMSRTALQPVLVLLTDEGLYNSSTVIIAEARRTIKKPTQPTHVALDDISGLPGRSVFQLEGLHPIDKRRLRGRAGQLTASQMEMIDTALRAGLYLDADDYLPVEVCAP